MKLFDQKKSNYIINDNMGMIDFLVMVERISDEYYDENGIYQPHHGLLNAMRLFYNECVIADQNPTSAYIDDEQESKDFENIKCVLEDDNFIAEFNNSIRNNATIGFTFGCAYHTALDIVETRKTSVDRIIDLIQNAVDGLVDKLSPALSQDTLEHLSLIARDIANGKGTSEAIIDDAYQNPEIVQKIIDYKEKKNLHKG